MPGRWGHLALRFVDVVTSKPLAEEERAMVSAWLGSPTEEKAFWDQPHADQRHALNSAQWVTRSSPHRLDLIRAALLHDIGKRHAALGPVGRSLASAAIKLRLPLPDRWLLYREHGPLGAADLDGAEPIVVEFARAHHTIRPGSIPADDWRLLVEADSFRLPGR